MTIAMSVKLTGDVKGCWTGMGTMSMWAGKGCSGTAAMSMPIQAPGSSCDAVKASGPLPAGASCSADGYSAPCTADDDDGGSTKMSCSPANAVRPAVWLALVTLLSVAFSH